MLKKIKYMCKKFYFGIFKIINIYYFILWLREIFYRIIIVLKFEFFNWRLFN